MNQSQNDNLSVRIVTADYYLDKPIPEFGDQCYSAFRSLPVYHVPVIRIFGPTSRGVKTCVHVHGVFPYIFVPNWNNQLTEKDLYNFAVNLDKAINTSFARSNSKASHVHKITQVSGKPFYGYHEGEKNFLKIEFYNPAMVKRAADLLLNAAVLNTVFQPHEAHIPYILQFFIDNNLYGMNNVTFSSYRVRKNDLRNDLSMDETVIHADSNVPKLSYSKLEIDVTVSSLCNVFSSGENVPNNPGLAFIWEEEKKRRRHVERPSQITPNESQERPEKPLTRTEHYFRDKLIQKLQAIKNNQNFMDIEGDETSSNSTYEELNTQSRSLLEMLQNLAGQQENNSTDVPRSTCSSPDLVYSDDENNAADISAISSQPLLKFSAEADSILGNNFSDEENDLDDQDHRALSQLMTYTRHELVSSDDSDADDGCIPQLDGAHDADSSSKRKVKSISRKGRPPKSNEAMKSKKNDIPSNSTSSVRSYNLRSRGKNQEETKPNDIFKPMDFKIILNRLDTKISPKKTYPRLNIDQKSPKSSISKSFNDITDIFIPKEKPSSLPNIKKDAFVPSVPVSPTVVQSKAANTSNSASKNDKRTYPQLGVSIKKSPKTIQLQLCDQKPIRGSASGQGLKKRKICFEEIESSKSNDNGNESMNFNNSKWKKSLKRRKKDDTSFKIGESFSLLGFRNSKLKSNLEKQKNESRVETASTLLNTNEINSQGYSLRVSSATDFLGAHCNVARSSAEDEIHDDGANMESLQILDSNGPENAVISVSSFISGIENLTSRERKIKENPTIDSDDELLLALPLDDIVESENHSSRLGERSEGKFNFEPILIVPHLPPNYPKSSPSPPIYENSLIELDVLKSDGDIASNSNLKAKDIDSTASRSSDEDKIGREKSDDLAMLHSKNSANSRRKNKTVTLPDPLTQPSRDQSSKDVDSGEAKIDKRPAAKKRSLGVRIRKNMKMASSSQSSSKEHVNDCENISEVPNPSPHEDMSVSGASSLPKIKKPATSPESYPNSSIELDVTKYLRDSTPQSSGHESSFQLRIEESCDMTSLEKDCEKIALKILEASINIDDKAQNVPHYEDSFVELDIFDCCDTSQDVLNNQKSANDDLATLHPICRGFKTVKASVSAESETESDFFDTSSQELSFECFQENTTTSQSHLANNQNEETNPNDPIAEQMNTSCSNDSLFCVLDALTPQTSAALNQRLDSMQSLDMSSASVLPAELTLHEPPAEKISTNDDSETQLAIVSSDNFMSPKRLQPQPTTSNAPPSRTRTMNAEFSEDPISLSDLAEPMSPSILDKTNYSICFDSHDSASDDDSEKILFEDDSVHGDSPKADVVEEPRHRSKLESLLMNSTIWESMNDDTDNEIKSFYHDETCTPSHITIIQDTADNSSPTTQPLTPHSAGNEILSFYDSQSPEGMVLSITDDLRALNEVSSEGSKSDSSYIECTQPERPTRMGKSSSSMLQSALHSTPRINTKKSPSPTYTPILKKLMLKKANKDKGRVSSPLFQSQSFLPEIKEVEEKKSGDSDKNTSLSLPLELEGDKLKAGNSLNTSRSSTCSGASYQIDGATLENTCGFKMNLENLQDVKIDKQYQYITLISMEIFAHTRGNLKPDPEYDAVTCIFYSIHHDAPDFPKLISGIIAVGEVTTFTLDVNRFKCDKVFVKDESELFDKFLSVIRRWDPDMLIGYEVEMLSWGFFIQRGHFIGRNCSQELSRVVETKCAETSEKGELEDDEYSNEIKLTGRIVLNVWRLMRHEANLQSYTFENILFHVQHQRVPCHTFKFLTECWKNPLKRYVVIDYFLLRAESNITILEQLDFICRTSELARLFGIQFYEVLSRGSQFRVESMMLRLAKKQNYVAVSPSVKQRFNMRAPECLPLIMEPESKFYTDPVLVLDFQSLYPSIVIAYNYCFSTCLGRIDHIGQSEPFHFGCVEHLVPSDVVIKLEQYLNLSPAGVAFVNKNIRKGILPSMLEEILETRLMVKKSMKENKDNSILKRVLHARQLGLKLIANVTYGYTSANFSGRMPCMEVADSIVSKGRETLERAIEMVNSTKKWAAQVVYGDTDSLFVLLPNRTKEEAFRIGTEIADAVTNDNPKPVKLKFEKVYLPCMLQTKKRYVGYMYESLDQEKPIYDAKGIETVRRDGCPAVSKILEKSLKLLFETQNVNTVKQYVQRQFTKLISGRISIQELSFAREYRGMNNYKPAACVPALQLARQALVKDRRAEPRIKERVPYVITTGPPGVPLIRLVRTPQEFLDTPGSLINTEYYITRAIIPALQRCFILMNVSVLSWYTELPKKQKLNLPIHYEAQNKTFKKTTISDYFSSSKCLSCAKVAESSICKKCVHKPQRIALVLGNMINDWQRKRNDVAKICRSCCGRGAPIECSSLDCPIYYLLRQTERDAGQVRYVEDLRMRYLYF